MKGKRLNSVKLGKIVIRGRMEGGFPVDVDVWVPSTLIED